jgi:hypothetical protein
MRNRKTEFNLTNEQRRELYDRQHGLCAISGEPLNESWIAHHVFPAGTELESNSFEVINALKDFKQNCVLVNDTLEFGGFRDEGPHIQAHEGSFSKGTPAPHSWFKHSHGMDKNAHDVWAGEGHKIASQLWLQLEQQNQQQHGL